MNPFDFFWHSLNFAAPAVGMALMMPSLGRLALGFHRKALLNWWQQMIAQFVAGLLVLAVGFWAQGHDGQMTTYGALVMVAATLQWALLRGWLAAGR